MKTVRNACRLPALDLQPQLSAKAQVRHPPLTTLNSPHIIGFPLTWNTHACKHEKQPEHWITHHIIECPGWKKSYLKQEHAGEWMTHSHDTHSERISPKDTTINGNSRFINNYSEQTRTKLIVIGFNVDWDSNPSHAAPTSFSWQPQCFRRMHERWKDIWTKVRSLPLTICALHLHFETVVYSKPN